MYCCHCFLISSASVRSIPFLSFIVPIFAWNGPLAISNLLEEISSLSHSVVFLYFFAWLLRKAFLSLLAVLWNSAFKWLYLLFSPLPFTSFLFSAIGKDPSSNHFPFFQRMVLITTSCTMSGTSIHSSSDTLSDLIPWVYLSLACIIARDLAEWPSGFPYFLQFKF